MNMQMQRRCIYIAITVILTLLVWIYRSSNTEVKSTIMILKDLQSNNRFVKDLILKPFNATCKKKPFLVIIVTSYIGHVELRSAHRRAMPADLLQSLNIVRIFLLAKIPPKESYITQAAIKDESNSFGDILQGSFMENYRNLTYKHLMGLQWAASACRDASFILKVDDDTVFNLQKTYTLLLKLNKVNTVNILMGYMLNNTIPRRNKQNKWYVTSEEYPRSEYPPYLSGWYYITTPKVASRIVAEAEYHPYFWIDDIFVTGILAETLNMKHRQLPNDYWLEYYELLECCLRDMVKKSIKCDHAVGPNGGRNNLLVEFNEAISNCDNWKNCTTRSVREPLNKVCVAYKDRDIFSDGQGEVQYIKL